MAELYPSSWLPDELCAPAFSWSMDQDYIPSSGGTRELDLGREGGHSKRRILHAKDVTGREVEKALLDAVAERKSVEVFENHFAIDLITTQKLGIDGTNRCVGVYVLNKQTGQVETFAAPVVVLATGGCGKVYLYTTNPDIATGDGASFSGTMAKADSPSPRHSALPYRIRAPQQQATSTGMDAPTSSLAARRAVCLSSSIKAVAHSPRRLHFPLQRMEPTRWS